MWKKLGVYFISLLTGQLIHLREYGQPNLTKPSKFSMVLCNCNACISVVKLGTFPPTSAQVECASWALKYEYFVNAKYCPSDASLRAVMWQYLDNGLYSPQMISFCSFASCPWNRTFGINRWVVLHIVMSVPPRLRQRWTWSKRELHLMQLRVSCTNQFNNA